MDNTSKHIESLESNRQISIWLDAYDDIFSDFDPRPYSERILSDDFIAELKKVSREEDFEIAELRLLMPEKSRKQDIEQIIIKRVHLYFRKGNFHLARRIKIIRGKAVLITLVGMGLMFLSSYISTMQLDKLYMRAFLVLTEPAGWFFVWTGMDDLFFSTRKRKEELDYFSKMAKTKVVFASF